MKCLQLIVQGKLFFLDVILKKIWTEYVHELSIFLFHMLLHFSRKTVVISTICVDMSAGWYFIMLISKKKMLLKTVIYLSKMCSIILYSKRGNSGWRSYVLAQGPLGIELDLYMYDRAKLNWKKLQQRLTFKGCLKRQCFAKEWSTF